MGLLNHYYHLTILFACFSLQGLLVGIYFILSVKPDWSFFRKSFVLIFICPVAGLFLPLIANISVFKGLEETYKSDMKRRQIEEAIKKSRQ